MYMCICVYIYIYIYIHLCVYIYIYIYIHGKVSPVPGRFELSKGILKRTKAVVLGFETINLKFCELKLRELTVIKGGSAI